MRIAVVTTSYPAHAGDPSGHFVQAEVREAERAGHDVVVVRPPPGGAFGWPGVSARVRERWARAIGAGAWLARARRQVARARAERLVAHWAVPCAWPIVGTASGELEVVSHGGDVRLLLATPAVVRERIAASIATRASVWRFVSEALKEDLLCVLERGTRAKVERIAVVRPASIELPDVRERVRARQRELAGRRAAVVVGRLVPGKRVDRVIAHVAAMGDGTTLVVVGDGPERGRLEAMAREKGVAARFVGLVAREEALAWMGAASVVLHASREEGCSTVRREAEALGVRWQVVE